MRVAHQLGEHPPGFHGAPVTSIAVDRRGRTLLAGGLTLRLYDAMSGVSARVWGPSRQWLAFGTVTGRVGVVDASGKDLRELSAEEAFSSTSSRVHALAVHPTRPLLAIAHGHDASVRLWNAETGQEIALDGKGFCAFAVCFSPDGTWLLSGHGDGIARLWDVSSAT